MMSKRGAHALVALCALVALAGTGCERKSCKRTLDLYSRCVEGYRYKAITLKACEMFEGGRYSNPAVECSGSSDCRRFADCMVIKTAEYNTSLEEDVIWLKIASRYASSGDVRRRSAAKLKALKHPKKP